MPLARLGSRGLSSSCTDARGYHRLLCAEGRGNMLLECLEAAALLPQVVQPARSSQKLPLGLREEFLLLGIPPAFAGGIIAEQPDCLKPRLVKPPLNSGGFRVDPGDFLVDRCANSVEARCIRRQVTRGRAKSRRRAGAEEVEQGQCTSSRSPE